MSMAMVAQAAKVSVSTVARVVNNRPGLRPETIEAVHEAMRTVGYVPPPVALRRGPITDARRGIRTRRIAMLLVAMEDKVLQRLSMPGPIAWALQERGLQMVFVPMPDPARLPPDIDNKQIDGVLLQGAEPTGSAAAKLKKMPVVWFMTRRSPDFWGDYVEPDNRAVGRLAFEYLVDQGCRDFAYLNLQPNYPAFAVRGSAFLDFCREAGLPATDLSVGAMDQSNQLHDISPESGVEEQVAKLMALNPRPRGLFCSGHNYLPMVYRALRQRGLTIGKDIRVISGDYDEVLRSALLPMPAFVDLQPGQIGIKAVEQLIWRMANFNTPGAVGTIMPPRLVLPDVEQVSDPSGAAAH